MKTNSKQVARLFVGVTIFLLYFPLISSAQIIINSVNGGNCGSIGSWDNSSKTCTLGGNINDSIKIEGDGIIFDGAGNSISGTSIVNGITVTGGEVTIKKLSIYGFDSGIYFDHSSYGKVEAVILENNKKGIYLNFSHYNEISESTIKLSKFHGIHAYYSMKNTISDNSIQENNNGIYEQGGGENTYQNNIASNNKITGIKLLLSSGSRLLDNKTDLNLAYGIDIISARAVTLKNNSMSGNANKNFVMDNDNLDQMDIDASNTLEGKYIYFVKNATNETFDSSMNIGAFYCLNCENITLKDALLEDKGAQVVLWQTSNSLLENVKSADKKNEVSFYKSNNNIVRKCDLGKIEFRDYSNDNRIYNNNFFNGQAPAYSWDSENNIFNLDISVGGNYWKINEVDCIDVDNNGICDLAYEFYGGIDNYPLAKEFTGAPPVPTGNSNVLFLPGAKASKLYTKEANEVENQLWPPNYFDNDLEQLVLDSDGDSINAVYTQDVVAEKPVTGGNIYKTFIEKLALLKSSEKINDYKLFAYDWRRSVEDVAQGETAYRGEIKRALAELESLADGAKNKKVTIIAHSNGGLVAKAMMLELEKAGKADKVDKIIFVGTPQMGTPLSIFSLLYGYDEASPLDILISQKDSRTLVENMPGAYGFLPSEKYFERAGEDNPFITFSSEHTRYSGFRNAYNESIFGVDEFKQFLTGDGDGRIVPDVDEIDLENRLNGKLISEAFAMHKRLDAWTPPENVKVIEIAGWGLDTISGIDYAEKEDAKCYVYPGSKIPSCTGIGDYAPVYEPKFTVDGDGVVVAPSALMLEEKEKSVEKYWVDLYGHNDNTIFDRNHGSILEVDSLQQFIDNIIESTDYASLLPEYIKASRPDDYKNAKPRIRMSLYSPLDIHLSDGIHKTGPEIVGGQAVLREEIPNSYYYQFGERKYVGFPSGENIHVTLNGYETGDYTLKLEEVRETAEGEEILAHTTFKNLPVSEDTVVSLDIPETGLANLSNLEADFDGDGANDYVVTPVSNGEAVLPDMIAPETSLKSSGTQGQNGWHIGDVSVELSAEDNKGGSGVDVAAYSIDGGATWQSYSDLVKISTEGVTNFQYFSVDKKGNKEDVKIENIKIDKTAPEAKLIFNQAQRKLDVVGVDNLPGNVSVTLEEKIIDQKAENRKGIFSWIFDILNKSKKKKQVTAKLVDDAGHKTEVVLEREEVNDHFSNLSPKTVAYDGVKADFSNALLQYKWLFDSRKSKYLLFGTHIRTDAELLEAHYFPKKNETWLMEKPRELDDKDNDDEAERRPNWKKLPGLVVPYFQTKQGKINIVY
ncbi:MAG: NosD domain-containing protein [Candidatus Moraniibacteriota bacterium]